MIIKESKVTSSNPSAMAPLHDYLLYGPPTAQIAKDDRVKYELFRNVFEDSKIALAEMIWTAKASKSTASKHQHFILSLSEGEHLDSKQWNKVLDMFLEQYGDKRNDYRKLQVMGFVHKDTDHEHLHLVVSRINPENGNRADVWQSKRKCNKIAHSINEQMNLIDYGVEKKKKTNNESNGQELPAPAKNIEAVSGEESFYRYMLNLKEQLLAASSWQEMHACLAKHGVKIMRKGQGMIFQTEDGKVACKPSKVSRDLSAKKLIERLGIFEEFADSSKNITKVVTTYQRKPLPIKIPNDNNYLKLIYVLRRQGVKIIEKQDRIVSSSQLTMNQTYMLLLVAKRKFPNKTIRVNGSAVFQRQCLMLAPRLSIKVECEDKQLQDRSKKQLSVREIQRKQIAMLKINMWYERTGGMPVDKDMAFTIKQQIDEEINNSVKGGYLNSMFMQLDPKYRKLIESTAPQESDRNDMNQNNRKVQNDSHVKRGWRR